MGDTSTRGGRNVYGMDIVISYSWTNDIVSVRQITGKEGVGGRFTIAGLLLALGHKEQETVLLFVKNNNLHNSGKGLRGALLLINNVIGLVVKTQGSFILFQGLLPKALNDSFHIIDLKRKNRHYGFFLQQVHGLRPAVLQPAHCSKLEEGGYPYMKEGYVFMDPGGPDFFIPSSQIPQDVRDKFNGLSDNLCTRNYSAPRPSIVNRRKSNTTVVVYVAGSVTRLSMGKHADCFYIPVGATFGHVRCPWESKDGSRGPLFHYQWFICVKKDQAQAISQWPTRIPEPEFIAKCMGMSGGKENMVKLIVPSFDWTLNIAVVTNVQIEAIRKGVQPTEYLHLKTPLRNMLFVRQNKYKSLLNGVTVSSWVRGDPQVTSTRVTYDYVSQYKATYGSGYGSRPRSSCLDSLNSYRDKRFNARAHPSPLIYDGDIKEHQYFSSAKQRSCLLQMKLESILHDLTHDVSCVARRLNPYMMEAVTHLSTKLIVTTGRSLFSFWNGLHVDSCDVISDDLRLSLFPKKKEEPWQSGLLRFGELSFPTTCGYQHVWRNDNDKYKHDVIHHFVMPGLSMAVSLEDGICHHFMGGAFAHSTGLCLLEEKVVGVSNAQTTVIMNNQDDFFHIFAWGSAANSRTARGNSENDNTLRDHRLRQQDYRKQDDERGVLNEGVLTTGRSRTTVNDPLAGKRCAVNTKRPGGSHGIAGGPNNAVAMNSQGLAVSPGKAVGQVPTASVDQPQVPAVPNVSVDQPQVPAVAAPVPYQGDDSDVSREPGFMFEDEDCTDDEPNSKKGKGLWINY